MMLVVAPTNIMSIAMIAVSVVVVVMSRVMIVIIFSIFFFTELIGLIPRCFYEYLECRIQMDDEDEEYETENTKYHKKYYLYTDDREKCDYTRNNKRKYEKYDSYEYRSKVEEYHRIVELHSDTDMTYCHSCGKRERFYNSAILKDYKKFCIRETHVQEECKYKISRHDIRNRNKKLLSEYSEEQYIKCNDRERLKYSNHIMCFEKRKKMPETIEYSLESTVYFFAIRPSIGVYHLHYSSFSKRGYKNIEYK